MVLLSFQDVSKSFRDGPKRRAVVMDRVLLEIDAGDYVGLQGARRSGKSTLLRIAAGLETPDEGRVCFAGSDVTNVSESRRTKLWRHGGIALVCGGCWPSGSQPVPDHVALGLLSDDFTPNEAAAKAAQALDRVGAGSYADRRMNTLSSGERMRVELARALAREPRLLLVDEPALVPGLSERRELYGVLRALGEDAGLALLVASEDLEAITGARRIMSIDGGQARSTDSHDNLVHLPDLRARGGDSAAS